MSRGLHGARIASQFSKKEVEETVPGPRSVRLASARLGESVALASASRVGVTSHGAATSIRRAYRSTRSSRSPLSASTRLSSMAASIRSSARKATSAGTRRSRPGSSLRSRVPATLPTCCVSKASSARSQTCSRPACSRCARKSALSFGNCRRRWRSTRTACELLRAIAAHRGGGCRACVPSRRARRGPDPA